MKKMLLACTLVGLMAVAAPAESFNFAGSGVNKTVNLSAGDEVNVSGSANRLVLTGTGDSLNVMGSANKLTVNAGLDAVDVVGSSNTITVDGAVGSVNLVGSSNKVVLIRRPGRELPSVNRIGANNTVTEQDGK